MNSTQKENTVAVNGTFILNGGTYRTTLLPTRIIGFIVIAVVLRYSILNFGDTTISEKPLLYFGLLLGITLGLFMLSVHPATALVARNAQALEILEDFIDEEDKRLDFLVELKLYSEGTVARPVNGKGSAVFSLEVKDRISTLKISQ